MDTQSRSHSDSPTLRLTHTDHSHSGSPHSQFVRMSRARRCFQHPTGGRQGVIARARSRSDCWDVSGVLPVWLSRLLLLPPPPPPPRIPSLLVLLSFLCLASLRWRSAALDDVGRRTTDGGKRRRRRRLGGLAGTSRGEEEWAAPCATRSCARLGLSVVSCLLHTHIYYHTSLHTYMLASRGRRRLLETVLGAIGAYRSRLASPAHFGTCLTRVVPHRELHLRRQWACSRGCIQIIGHPLHTDRAQQRVQRACARLFRSSPHIRTALRRAVHEERAAPCATRDCRGLCPSPA